VQLHLVQLQIPRASRRLPVLRFYSSTLKIPALGTPKTTKKVLRFYHYYHSNRVSCSTQCGVDGSSPRGPLCLYSQAHILAFSSAWWQKIGSCVSCMSATAKSKRLLITLSDIFTETKCDHPLRVVWLLKHPAGWVCAEKKQGTPNHP
jgi:hypothetical protein